MSRALRGRAVILLLIAGAAVLVIAGCGGGSSTDAASSPHGGSAVEATKAYAAAWVNNDPAAACEALTGTAKRAVVTSLSETTGSLSCTAAMREAFQLLGPEELAQLHKFAATVSPADLTTEGHLAHVQIDHDSYMELRNVGGTWYIEGNTLEAIEPLPPRIVISKENAEELVTETLEEESIEAVTVAVCPDKQQAVAGDPFVCEAELANGVVETISYRITDSQGDLSLLSIEPPVAE